MHCNSRLSTFSRKLLIERYQKGEKISQIAKQLGVSRKCCYKWINRYKQQGEQGLQDKRPGPKTHLTRISRKKEEKILKMRRKYRQGPDRLAIKLDMPRSTVYKVLKRNGVNHLFEKKKRQRPRYYQKTRPGECLQVDLKQIPSLEGKGYNYQISVLDDCTRYTQAAIFDRRTTKNVTSFVKDCLDSFPFDVKEIKTDNGMEFTLRYSYFKGRKTMFEKELVKRGIRHRLIKPRCPTMNGKVERFHRTVDEELYHIKHFINEAHRRRELKKYIEVYNTKRIHLGINGMTPQQKLNIFLDEKCYQVA